MKWSLVLPLSFTMAGLFLSSCGGQVPEGLLLPKVVGMNETASANDVILTCTLSGNVDGSIFFLGKDGAEVSRSAGTKENDGSYSCTIAGLKQDTDYSWWVVFTNGKDEVRSETRTFRTDRLPYDPALWNCILENFDTDGDGRLSEEEKLAAKELNLSEIPLASLSGIEELPYLERLYLLGNGLKEPDFSVLPNLDMVACGRDNYQRVYFDNPKLTYLYIISTPLKELDLSKLPALGHLDSFGSPLERLSFSVNPELWQVAVEGSEIRELDLSANPKIGILYLKYNEKLETVWLASGCEPDIVEVADHTTVQYKP